MPDMRFKEMQCLTTIAHLIAHLMVIQVCEILL